MPFAVSGVFNIDGAGPQTFFLKFHDAGNNSGSRCDGAAILLFTPTPLQ
jgi:hypothetical protein